ncbi:MAG: ParB/RepB/Spo0J family partition protein [Armatimonadota bacterium]|nr:ParB/RepB/Spo0J family partition protein [Armatimonadota bacterium]MDR7428846.1 ParB/RepB/Spo0J family partition protein [Armatimonadota bacterium]MDR7431525.1 ParB/RepB/Spo0J family partition protein [Armatimonadota bacterium]MDR7461627.1 ParB/RepB/Spo0J family partition protein [Armatimonadota bacterium]MDR7514516.1 ParB/RepB/Spo0J family partition protein [Armatimonadota bacterium]
MSPHRPRGLGRGLAALIPGAEVLAREERIEYLPLDRVRPGKNQPRSSLPVEELEELAASVRVHGILQPIVVRPSGDGYEIVAGERRWRAAVLAGLATVPAVVRQVGELESLALALVENLQRQDLNPVERARAYRRLVQEFGLSQQEIARLVGRSQPAVANTLRLLSLPQEVLQAVEKGQLSEAHARLLLEVEDPGRRVELARLAVARRLTTRELGRLVRPKSGPARARRAGPSSPDLVALEEALSQRLGTRVRVRTGRGRGVVEIEFYSDDDLSRICELVLGGPLP